MDDNKEPISGFSIQVEHRTSRSNPTKIVQSFLKPFRSQLVKVKQVQPAGSPELTPHPKVYEHCNVYCRTICDIKVYDIAVRSKSTRQFVAYQESVQERPYPDGSMSTPNQSVTPDFPTGPGARQTVLQIPEIQQRPEPASNGQDGTTTAAVPLEQTHTNTSAGSDGAPLMPALSHVRTRDFAHTPSSPRPNRRKHRRHIYYFCGGSWQMPPTGEHWKLLAYLTRSFTARGTPTTVSVVSYPLAPKSPSSVSFPMLERLYYELFPRKAIVREDGGAESPLDPSTLEDPEIVLAGDSSGGNVALALTMHVLNKDADAPAPDSLLLICPTVDMRNENAEIAKLSKKDPVLSAGKIDETHAVWLGADMDAADPRVSPILGDVGVLKRRGVRVNGVNAGYDVLGADARLFIKKMSEEGVRGKWLEWDKMMHVWPLTFSYGLPEGKEAVKWIIETVDPDGKRPKVQMAYEE